jgi:predicted AlkP superfamily phosphohydrolase/phosphomutase
MSPPRGATASKVFILGFDGATPELITAWAARGELPHFAHLLRHGAWGTLQSTIHPLTPQAWTSLLTGTNPGKHGVFDFSQREPDSYRFGLANSRSRRSAPIWNIIGPAGRSTGVVNVPLTYPPEPLPGFMISGMHSPSLEKAVFPKGILTFLQQEVPDYRIDVMSHWYRSYDTFLEHVREMGEARLRAVTRLHAREQPDCMIAVFVGIDRLQHALWGQMDHPAHPGARAAWKYAHAVLDAYRQADRFLGRIQELLDDQTVLIVISDHGFGNLDKDVYLNRFLLDEGFLRFDDRALLRSPRDIPLLFDDPAPEYPWLARHPRLARRLPFRLARPALARAVRKGWFCQELRSFERIDWKHSEAYSAGLFGNIYLNLKGREPQGIVEPGDEARRVRQRIKQRLLRLRDPDDGFRLVDRVFEAEELYAGAELSRAPDLIVVMRDWSCITRGGAEFAGNRLVSPPRLDHTGNHRLHGICGIAGAPVRAGARLRGARIIDILPTALALLDVHIPPEIDGRCLSEAFHPPLQPTIAPPVPKEKKQPLIGRPPEDEPYSTEEQQAVEQRLRDLGYLE